MQRINNYGSLLQSYALRSMLESLGHEVGFLDIETGDTTHAGEAPSDSPTRHLSSTGGDNFVYKLKEKLVAKRQFASFRTRFLGMSGELDTDSSAFDAVVIGSDEVFNYSVGCSWGFSPQLFGEVRSNSVISYAASCGYARPEDVLDVHRDALAAALGKLSAVSVRDEPTRRFVTAFGVKDPVMNLDPVLVYDFAEELGSGNPESGFLLVYGYTRRFSDPAEIDAVQGYAHENGLKTVCVGGWQPWCDKYLCPDPFGALSLFRSANAVVTDTFHGTIMASKFNKPLAVFLRPSNSQKLGDLVERVHIKGSLVHLPGELASTLQRPLDYEAFNAEIVSQRKRTMDYLESSLGRC